MNPPKSPFDDLIDGAPDELQVDPEVAKHRAELEQFWKTVIPEGTGMPERYRLPWERPTDKAWNDRLEKLVDLVSGRRMAAMVGPRGHGKTRLAAEAMRESHRTSGRYLTAMRMFLEIRESYRGKGKTELELVDEMVTVPLLIIDEIQERGETEWEDRILTHVIDARYAANLSTIIIANLTAEALMESLGESIASRLCESGEIMQIISKSHRLP